MIKHIQIVSVSFVSFFLLLIASPTHAAVPEITSISPTIGPIGQVVIIQGNNFTNSNTIDFGFGRQHNVNPTGPTSSTLGVVLLRCPNDETCDPRPHQGYINIFVKNENGESNKVKFLIAPHGGGCYNVDNFDDPGTIMPVSCSSSSCNAGTCQQQKEPDPTPKPSPTPSSSPSPTPSPKIVKEDDEEEDNNGTGTKKLSSGSSSSSDAQPLVSKTYPTREPSAVDQAAPDYIPNDKVVSTVEAFYTLTYSRRPNFCASHYWKIRARSDKATRSKLLGAMQWQKLQGRDPIYLSCQQGKVAGVTTAASNTGKITHQDINRLYRVVHSGQNPTPAFNKYWISRLKDKPTEAAMLGAMQWHKLNLGR